MDAAVPGLTSARIFDDIHERCIHIRAQNCKLFDPRQYAAPAAYAQIFLSGAVGVKLPSHQDWLDAYASDPVMHSILWFVENPGLITNKSLEESKLDANYRSALRQSLISIENGILIYRRPSSGPSRTLSCSLSHRSFATLSLLLFMLIPLALISLIIPSSLACSDRSRSEYLGT